jgi:hypothetical protein
VMIELKAGAKKSCAALVRLEEFKQSPTGGFADFKIVGARCSACGFLDAEK